MLQGRQALSVVYHMRALCKKQWRTNRAEKRDSPVAIGRGVCDAEHGETSYRLALGDRVCLAPGPQLQGHVGAELVDQGGRQQRGNLCMVVAG